MVGTNIQMLIFAESKFQSNQSSEIFDCWQAGGDAESQTTALPVCRSHQTLEIKFNPDLPKIDINSI